MAICKNCKTEVSQNYCPNCGHPATLPRIDGKYLLQEVRELLNFERGYLFTIKELTINPGKSILDFLNENRNRLVKPIVFLIISSLIYSILNSFFHFDAGYIDKPIEIESAIIVISQWVHANYGYANIILAIFIGLWLKVFFKKHKFNIFEILILLCFVMGMGMLIYTAFGIVQSLTHINLQLLGIIVGFIYTTYAVGQFFNKRKLISYVKAFFAYILGMITFSIAVLAIGVIIDLILR